MVRHKNVVVPVADRGLEGPTHRSHNSSRSTNRRKVSAVPKGKLFEEPDEPEKKPPKPQIELNLIEPPKNPTIAKLLEIVLGPSYLAGHVRRMPDGSIAKPKLVVTPKASQHTPGSLLVGRLFSIVLVLWSMIGFYFELRGDERILSLLGDPSHYVENAEYNWQLLNWTLYHHNLSALYVHARVNSTFVGPMLYENFTCMYPVRCDAGVEEGGCQGHADDFEYFESAEFLAEQSVIFTNRSDSNATRHYFPWYPAYRHIHDGYNWAKVQRRVNSSGPANASVDWTPEVDELGRPTNEEDIEFQCDVISRDGSLGLMEDLAAFLGNRTLDEFLGIPKGEFDVQIEEEHFTFRYYFGAASQCQKDNDDAVACLNHSAHPPYICGYSFDCYAVELPDDEYELYANTYCNTLKPTTCLLESTIFLCELRIMPYTPPANYNASSSIGIFVDSTATASNVSRYVDLILANYSQVWATPFSTLKYWEVGTWSSNLRKTGSDLKVANDTNSSQPDVWITSPAGSFQACMAVPSTSIDLTWCYTNSEFLMAGLDRGEGEYLSDIVDAYEIDVQFDTGVAGFLTDCYEADWFESMNDEGWSVCDQNYYLNGLHIGEENTYLYFLEAGSCCRVAVMSEFVVQRSVDLECVVVDWDGTTNNTCPEDHYLQGFYREPGTLDDADRVWRLTQARCCSTAIPSTCSDGRMNGIEEGVDCGGECEFECGELCYGDFSTGVTTEQPRQLLQEEDLALDRHLAEVTTMGPQTTQVLEPSVAFLEWKEGSAATCTAAKCQEELFYDGATIREEEVTCCLQICLERGFYVTQEPQFDYIFDIEPKVQQPTQYCRCEEAIVGRGTFSSSSIRGSFTGDMTPDTPEPTQWNFFREEGGASLALTFNLGDANLVCKGIFLVDQGEILGVDESAFLESPLFLASQYNMWYISEDASTILWTDFYDDIHMTFDNNVYNLEQCMVPSAAFHIEVETLSSLNSFAWFLWVVLVVVGIVWLFYLIFVTATHKVLLHPTYRGSAILWSAWQGAMWLWILTQACKSLVYMDLLVKGIAFDAWYPDFEGVVFDSMWLLRGFDEDAFEDLIDPAMHESQSSALKSILWSQVFLVGFNCLRTYALDWSRKLAPSDESFQFRVIALASGVVAACLLLIQPIVQLETYAIAMRFQLSQTSQFPSSPVDVHPAVFLAGVSFILSAIMVVNTLRLGVAGYFPILPINKRKDVQQGFRNFRSATYGVMGGCDQNFSDATGKFVFTRLISPIGLGPFAAIVGIIVLSSPAALKNHMLGVVGMESFYCAFNGAVLDIAIAVNVLFFIGMCVVQFVCFTACRN